MQSRSAAIIAIAVAMASPAAHAQWWTAAPADYEDCAERATKSALAGEAKIAALTTCESKFAGRRKPGGGYLYHDFMQNRSFDLKGPNPTAAEQKLIDEQYAAYLDEQRRSIILAAFAKKQSETQPQSQSFAETDFRDADAAVGTASQPAMKPTATSGAPHPRPKPHLAKGPDCAKEPLACGWSKLSSGLKDIKDALFGAPSQPKNKRT